MLQTELNHWKDLKKSPHVWVRDDDLQKVTPAFQRLMLLPIPLMIAVVPEGFDTACMAYFRSEDSLVQHGIAHKNYGEMQKIEMVDTPYVYEKLSFYFKWLSYVGGKHFKPILVPPWNRIEKRLVNKLKDMGYEGLSVMGDDFTDNTELKVTNVHIDTTLWKQEKAFKSLAALEEELASVLIKHRIQNRMDVPIGILTHHMTMSHQDFEIFDFFIKKIIDLGCRF